LKRTLMVVAAMSITSFNGMAWANNVTDDLSPGVAPEVGSVLYYGTPSGNSQGTWGLPSTIPGLQGAPGETGATGPAGANGLDGQSIVGPAGAPGSEGTPGVAGTPGTNGADGATGAQGVAGAQGVKGNAGTMGAKGATGAQGVRGDAANAPAIDPRLNVRIRQFDSQHWTLASFASFGMTSQTARYIVGEELTLKLGKSYEERRLDALESRIAARRNVLGDK